MLKLSQGRHTALPFAVLRVATFDEYLSDLDDETRAFALKFEYGGSYFYEVSVD